MSSQAARARGMVALVFALSLCTSGADHLDFPGTAHNAIEEEDLAFCGVLSSQEHPQPPAGGWKRLDAAPDGMLVWGKMDSSGGEDAVPAAKFFVLGTIANVSAEALIQTVEGIDLVERRSWDSSCLVLQPLQKDGEDDIVQWKTDFPWPLSDREFVYRRRLVHDGKGGAIGVSKAIRASSEWVPEEKSVIRIRDFVQYSAVRPLEDGSGVSFALLCKCEPSMHVQLPCEFGNLRP